MKKLNILWLLFLATGLFARTLDIHVIDGDLDFPLEGVQIGISESSIIYYTDYEGNAVVELSEENPLVEIRLVYPGYASLVIPLGENPPLKLDLEMRIAGLVDGEELVVERSAPGVSRGESGISVEMDKEMMDSTANMGVVEDVMSSIKTLPGVMYPGSFNARPSIRGGDPQTMTAMLDGIYVTYPYHWGGSFSIFNPNMVERAKLSHGVFSSRYGRALSGILEVESAKPGEVLEIDGAVSTTSTDLFFKLPISENMGLLLGGKATYLDGAVWIFQKSEEIPTPPYIRDLYGSWNYRPSNSVEWAINGFFGSDGVAAYVNSESDQIESEIQFEHQNLVGFGALSRKWSPNNLNLMEFSGGYNYNQSITLADIAYRGSREYSDSFLLLYNDVVDGADSYSVDGMGFEYTDTLSLHQGQVRFQWDRSIRTHHMLSFGLDEVFLYSEKNREFDGYIDMYGTYQYRSFQSSNRGNRVFHTSLYGLWEWGAEHSSFQGELGVRAEHSYIWNEHQSLSSYPVVNPRLQFKWALIEDKGILESLTFSMGSGLFSQFPLETASIQKEWDLPTQELGPNQSFYQVVGTDIQFLQQWSFQMEAYYKYFFNRLYITSPNDTSSVQFDVHQDGIGHAVGFDIMVQRDLGKKIDGYLSYSFVYTRLLNPYQGPQGTYSVEPQGAPLNQWFYPDYHRFHTANLVVNWNFWDNWKFTTTATIASGAPKDKVGEVYPYPTEFNGQIIERYTRDSSYSDVLRNDYYLPLDIRISYSFGNEESPWRHEFYFAVEDLFATVYSPQGVTQFSPITGEEEPGGVDFIMGIPIPSIGYKASY